MVCELLLALLPAAAASGAGSAPPDLSALMATLAGVRTLEARFVEKKEMSLLAEPLVTEGRMAFRAPGELARVVTEPRPTRTVVTPQALITVRGDQVERLDLGARPEVRALVTALLSLLQGDLDALRASFDAGYETGDDGRWTLTLTPRAERIRGLVERLEFEGRGADLVRYTVREASGDVAVTEVSDLRTGVGFEPEAAARWFGLP